MPVPEGHRIHEMWRIRAIVDSLQRLSRSRSRCLEKDLDFIFRDRFLVHAMARDGHAARQIDEATEVPLATLCSWRDHLEVMRRGDRGIIRLATLPIAAS
jgi:hypothetical protein